MADAYSPADVDALWISNCEQVESEVTRLARLLLFIRTIAFNKPALTQLRFDFEDWCAVGGMIPLPAIWFHAEILQALRVGPLRRHGWLLRVFPRLYYESWVLRNLVAVLEKGKIVSAQQVSKARDRVRRREWDMFEQNHKTTKGPAPKQFFAAQDSPVDLVEELFEYRLCELLIAQAAPDKINRIGLGPWVTFRHSNGLNPQSGIPAFGPAESAGLDWGVIFAAAVDYTITVAVIIGYLAVSGFFTPDDMAHLERWVLGIGPGDLSARQLNTYLRHFFNDTLGLKSQEGQEFARCLSYALQAANDAQVPMAPAPTQTDNRDLYDETHQSSALRGADALPAGYLVLANQPAERWQDIQNIVTVTLTDYRAAPTWRANRALRPVVDAAFWVHDQIRNPIETPPISNSAAAGISMAISRMIETNTSNEWLGLPSDPWVRTLLFGLGADLHQAVYTGRSDPWVIGAVKQVIRG